MMRGGYGWWQPSRVVVEGLLAMVQAGNGVGRGNRQGQRRADGESDVKPGWQGLLFGGGEDGQGSVGKVGWEKVRGSIRCSAAVDETLGLRATHSWAVGGGRKGSGRQTGRLGQARPVNWVRIPIERAPPESRTTGAAAGTQHPPHTSWAGSFQARAPTGWL